MVAFITQRFFFLKKNEIWFYNGEEIREETYNTYCYACVPFSFKFDYELTETTIIIDLTLPESELFQAINTTFRYHIRKAGKLNLEYKIIKSPTIEDCNRLINGFNEFASEKKITPMIRKRIFALQSLNKLIVTRVSLNGSCIVSHVYLHDSERIVLLHSFHEIKNEISDRLRGYANKLLHWRDITSFKEMGFSIYDFGGINHNTVPGISRFKLSFGGETMEVKSYIRVARMFKLLFKFYKFITSLQR